ncbi:hypothetical protein CMUS01_04624 [Colletotrichum musicola]|uniref:Uncharacterized protein n=1 Tax=Colletotrichum musicola TaxID=2175873 RepID=A0A8H6KX19_9PEZI|nr:hypothetical protein CMUS01_04624 [Colletotrichum musicola]
MSADPRRYPFRYQMALVCSGQRFEQAAQRATAGVPRQNPRGVSADVVPSAHVALGEGATISRSRGDQRLARMPLTAEIRPQEIVKARTARMPIALISGSKAYVPCRSDRSSPSRMASSVTWPPVSFAYALGEGWHDRIGARAGTGANGGAVAERKAGLERPPSAKRPGVTPGQHPTSWTLLPVGLCAGDRFRAVGDRGGLTIPGMDPGSFLPSSCRPVNFDVSPPHCHQTRGTGKGSDLPSSIPGTTSCRGKLLSDKQNIGGSAHGQALLRRRSRLQPQDLTAPTERGRLGTSVTWQRSFPKVEVAVFVRVLSSFEDS